MRTRSTSVFLKACFRILVVTGWVSAGIAGCGTPSDPLVLVAGEVMTFADSKGTTKTDVGQIPINPDTTPLAEADGKTGGACDGEPPACAGEDPSGGLTFNCPCTGNADCASGLCIQTPAGKVCTVDCVDCCDAGFSCAILAGSCPDCRQACLPAALNLCRPCLTNAECENPYAPSGERCVDFGAAGKFCGTSCSDIVACPAGYTCSKVTSVDGGSQSQCVPESGTCECSTFASEQGAQTSCTVTNDLGTCAGTRVCTPGGLGACEAPAPSAEECDGKDNDCDGLSDEATCPQGEACVCNGNGCACGCPPGLVDCGSGCIDVKSSVAHCGDCQKPCVGDHVATFLCQDSSCSVAKCEGGFEDLDLLTATGCECTIGVEVCDNQDNDCDNQSDEGDDLCSGEGGCTGTCTGEGCECSAECDSCKGTCVPLAKYAKDTKNCGYCGNDCALEGTAIHTCEQGACCAAVCKTGFKDCNKDCLDGCEWEVNAESCDGLDNDCNGQTDEAPLTDCGGTKVCVTGKCQCDPTIADLQQCGGNDCIDLKSDAKHCGICGNDCDALGMANVSVTKCANKACAAAVCKSPWVDVDGESWNGCECQKTSAGELCDGIDNDCDGQADELPFSDCTGAKICQSAKCICDPTISGLSQCAGDDCVDVNSDSGHCGFCGNDCDGVGMPNVAVTSCVAKECGVAVCTSPWVNVDGKAFNGCECEKTATAETCDNKDNDCDGVTDTYTEACSTLCGTGIRSCSGGEWSNCDAKAPIQCKDFSTCKDQPVCLDSCPPPPNETCNGFDDNCNGKADEGFLCSPGDDSTQACGNCGSQATKCNAQCQYEAAGACLPGGICKPGDTDTGSCGLCGTQKRTCTAQCGWTQFGQCENEGLCAVGSSDSGKCGKCGTQTRPCTAACQWGGFGSCLNEGICATGETSSQPCGLCGTQERTCSGSCAWGGYGACQNEGACSPNQVETGSCGNCGTRTRVCGQNCQWGGWTGCGGEGVCAANTSDSTSCGLCGSKTRNCTSQCQWGGYSACSGEGVCSPNQSDSQGCGNCGSQSRTCTAQCQWGSFGACGSQGACSPGQPETQGCGNCGSQTRTCGSNCAWGGFGSCSGSGPCFPGQSENQGCGKCGTQQKTCSNSCQWGLYGNCNNQGVCTPNETENQGCGDCGTRSRTCSSSCGWNSYGSCNGQGECSPNSTRACTNACGTETCNGSCGYGQCDFNKDSREPNDTVSNPSYIGSISEGGSLGTVTNAWLHQTEFDVPGEYDRYKFLCQESGNWFDGTMVMSTTASGLGAGWHALCIYFDRGCNNGIDVTKCTSGYASSLSINTGNVDAQDGSDDDGCIQVEIYGDWSCSAYSLSFACN